MKKLFFALIAATLLSMSMKGQEDLSTGFVFDEYRKGTVFYKTGEKSTGNLNYNTNREKFYFISPDSVVLELANPSEIVVVTIGDRAFVHVKSGIFYERINTGSDFLYVRWKSAAITEGKSGAYGMKSPTSAIDAVDRLSSVSGIHDLKIDENRKYIPMNIYFVKIGGKYKQFNSFESLAKLFKGNDAKIREYVKTENLNFKKLEDVKKAVAYCFPV